MSLSHPAQPIVSDPRSAECGRPADSANPTQLLERFQAADWQYIPLELTRYAVFKIQRLNWRTAQGLPCGVFAQDLAQGAIQKALDGILSLIPSWEAGSTEETEGDARHSPSTKGIRLWNPVKQPDLLSFLKSIVDSDVSALVNREEHRLNRYDLEPQEQEAIAAPAETDPEALLIESQRVQRDQARVRVLMDELLRACSTDTEESRLLAVYLELNSADEELKASRVAQLAGLTETQARNARRRIERKSRLIQARLRGGENSRTEAGRLENAEA